MKKFMVIAVLAVGLVAGPARADFPDAVQAYDGGDFESAYGESLTEARRGNVEAQYMVGFLLMRGEGARADPVRAYGWFILAARAGDDFAAAERDRLEGRMSAAQISRSKAWADGWTANADY